ncbi:glycoside hydrolase family 127 protein [Faecalicatena contorta]|uniref:glycoside hydrolase family 127 protein n=1 Tax=Faecalicatena contorta TaxID=39482 RepID=UPI001F44C7F2|nr:beta-L-arabinofuranosidase domain-containing protein [Faecalicatena contorta]MCF2555156.1 glycoside hydrolase family 127 protein [Faecalicatena contorta]
MLKNVELKDIQIKDSFWNKYIDLVEEVILPFQWELINDRVEGAEKSYCIQNLRIAAGQMEGEHRGMPFQDTDVGKWLEAVGFSLAKKRNEKLEKIADEAIDLIAAAQCEDGYLNTYFTITGKPRWSNLFEGHELYTAGHLIEAAVAYYQATGKRKILDVMCRFADNIYEVFGKDEGKCHGYPGHPEVELALVKLYKVTGEKKYLELADYFVKARGEQPCYFFAEEGMKNGEFIFPEFADFDMDYAQAHMPLSEQMTAEGHAVRAVYLYSAMADLAGEYKDEKLLKQCETLWENIVQKRMYITGSIGSASYGERFTTDYDLPNNTNYSESCATIGLAMFSNRMFQITREGKYMDIVEKALYNTLLSGIAMDGRHFFYVNPLEVVPEVAEHNPTMRHVKTTRQKWFGVACCPPNIARTLASMGNYMYDVEANTLYSNLFISNEIRTTLECGDIAVKVEADYPRTGEITYQMLHEGVRTFTLAIRKPGFSSQMTVKVNGEEVSYTLDKGYVYLNREWNPQDEVTVLLDVAYRFVRCNPRVRDNIGKIALVKGPWVYCLEEADNGKYLNSIVVDADCEVKPLYDEELLGGTMCAVFEGKKINYDAVGEELYDCAKPVYETLTLKAIPYCAWNNRGKGEMLVWMRDLSV